MAGLMDALVWKSSKNVAVEQVPKPKLEHSRDAIVRVTAATICGSDLHIYKGSMQGMKSGDILGHEAIGIIEELGSGLPEKLTLGQKVVISAMISCGSCEFCKRNEYSLCSETNPSVEQEKMLGKGHRTCGIFGYSHLMGGYAGGQAQFVRVPYADVNLLPVPSNDLSDQQLVLLSDVACTGWHGCELGQVGPSSTVVVWGLGPVGLMALVWARERGARTLIGIDKVPARLDLAKDLGFSVINFAECSDVTAKVVSAIPGGPSVCIDCVGFDYSKSWAHTIEQTVHLETDAIDSVTEAILACKMGGRVVLIGVYVGLANHFPIGAVMNKALTVTGGQVYVQKYWTELLEKMKTVDTSFLFTHELPLSNASQAYEMFNDKQALKVLLRPWAK
eukprot:TRINITY_DN3228_c1_g2_i1.p1 TRINITY_DN3228_c1_g2~~TRINITY_DN3228_c1_g2_i1.p1  ORF type:complete len:391 (-),score=49.30 TRINITY_DN3228_c1_g2_i1:93-1265(-)